ncbi:YbaN family protein [Eubacteriaceae bacterium DSM 108706]|uniref:YbaN family protein n=1 Tax=Gallibacter intestinalis TaxID=2779356 RepID=A0ABR9QWF4_9FIRM|nr:YbaN family protein [Gallibacter intestinalis]
MNILWLILGWLSLAIGSIGVVLPVLPTTPFLLVASFSFAKGSDRFHRWFTGTKLYKKHLENFVTDRAMTLKTKFGILLPASAMLIIAMLLVPSIHFRIFIVFLIIFKYVYFSTKIKTIKGAVEVD